MLKWLELEERVGSGWHALVGDRASYPHHPEASVSLDSVRGMLAVLFRGLGGGHGVTVAAAGAEERQHRLSLRQRLGMSRESMVVATLGENALRLPPQCDLFPSAALNRDLYLWLGCFFALVPPMPDLPTDNPLQADLLYLRWVQTAVLRILRRYGGMVDRYRRLCQAVLVVRPQRRLSKAEAQVESLVQAMLNGTAIDWPEPATAPRGYRPFLMVPLWGEIRSLPPERRVFTEEAAEAAAAADGKEDDRKRKAKRQRSDQAERDDPLILNRFEKILSLAEMVNVNRGVEDDEEEDARKAADDLDEITVAQHTKKPATRIRLDLDLPPDAVLGESLTGSHTYPEWDYRQGIFLPHHCRVLTGPAAEEGEDWTPDASATQLIRRVRRQFEALRPRRMTFYRQADGDALDMEAVVRAQVDRRANGTLSNRVYAQSRPFSRDLSVAVLVDVSLSTDAWIDQRRVLDVEKESLSVLLAGLAACGDEHGVFTFTSRRRDFVRVQTVKDFDEDFGPKILRRISALRPGYYTRIGAAVRHVTHLLEQRPHRHRLLLLLTDGKPNDVDHYEGRFGIEDTRRAILDARRKGLSLFGVTIDRKAQDYFPALFGRGHYAIVSALPSLSRALPRLYHSLSA